MNKTIYLKNSEAEIWERARKLSNGKISPVIVKALKKYIVKTLADACPTCKKPK